MYQKTIVVGNLGSEPEMRYMPDGTAVCNFSLAVNSRYNDRNGQPVDRTTWFRISVWGRAAEAANQYLLKGSKALVEGELQADPNTGGPRIWQRRDGTAGASFELRANTVKFLSTRGDEGNNGGYSDNTEEDQIPF